MIWAMRVDKCFSAAGVEIVARPYLVEDELSKLAQACSEDWIKWLDSQKLIDQDAVPISLEILNGGKFYYSQAAWNAVHQERPAGLMQLRARRGHASAESYGGAAHNDKNLEPGMELYQSPGSDWCVRLWDIPPQLSFTGPVLVGDTIATGTTLVGVLGWLVEKMATAQAVHDIHVFTIVGASEWTSGDGGVIEKLKHVDEALQGHGKQLTITFCNATFALAPNGTDLSPCPAKGAQWLPEGLKMLEELVGGDFPLAQMQCGVWDWGDRFTKPLHHLEEVLEHYQELAAAPSYITAALRERIESRGGAPNKKQKVASPSGAMKRIESKAGMKCEE